MKRFVIPAAALLVCSAAANALTISAPTVIYGLGPERINDLVVPISVSGGEMIKSSTISIAISGGTITGLERRVGIFANGANAVDPPVFYTDSQGRSAVWSDYSLAFTQAPVPADGIIAILHIDATASGSGVKDILLAGTDAGDTTVSDAQGVALPAIIQNGAFIDVPEPAGLALLAVGALFLRRRV